MFRKKLFFLALMLIVAIPLSYSLASSSSGKIWYCIDECCVEYPNNVCEYHYEDGTIACAFPGIPVNNL